MMRYCALVGMLWVIVLGTVATAHAASADASTPALTEAEKVWLKKHGVIRVHNEMNWPPFNFNEGGTPTGFSIDYMNLLAAKLNMPIRYITGPEWDDFLQMIRNGSLDVMLNIVNTPGRREFMAFSDPYITSPTGIFVTRDNTNIHSLDDLNGKTVAIPRGFFFEEILKKSYPRINLLLEEDALQNLESVAFGRADATIGEPGVMKYLIDTHFLTNIKLAGQASDRRFTSDMSLGVAKDQTTLLDILQKAVRSVSAQELQQLYARWNLDATRQEQVVALNEAETTYLSQLNTVRVCVNSRAMPYEGIDEAGVYEGISSELVKLLGKRLNIAFEAIPTGNFNTSVSALEAHVCDVMPMVLPQTAVDARLRDTKPYLNVPVVLATRTDEIFLGDTHQLAGKTIGYVPGIFSEERIHKRYPDLKLEALPSLKEGVAMLREGQVDGIMDTVAALAYGMQQNGWYDMRIAGRFDEPLILSMAFRSDDQLMQGIIQKSLNALGPDAPKSLYDQWVSIKYVQSVDYTWVWRGLLALGVVLVFLWYRNRQLSQFNRRLEAIAVTDALTGIHNRKKLDEVLKSESERVERDGGTFSVILLDLDHFKKVNDAYGHQEGDAVLLVVCDAVRRAVSHRFTFGRWGGEEFMVICPDTPLLAAASAAEIIRREIMLAPQGAPGPQTASLGVGEYRRAEGVQSFLPRVDEALYEAKRQGRNCVMTAEKQASPRHPHNSAYTLM
ncbi:diguanylate cyclase [Pokkaliibacter sp. CJK22405]|uniref:diguanylate cyclase n=1 Tax=Pokkaliibacter sp. CJK22405 TaxID=3384615 RepID=UPI0039847E37